MLLHHPKGQKLFSEDFYLLARVAVGVLPKPQSDKLPHHQLSKQEKWIVAVCVPEQ
jgi:hypothetical protein